MLQAEELAFRYRSSTVLEGLSHNFQSGALTAVTGPSGVGKTTLLFLLGLLLKPATGAVLLDGRDVASEPDTVRSAIRARKIGFLFQDAQLDPAVRAIDNILEPCLYAGVPRSLVRERAFELLRGHDLADLANRRSHGLSGGQAQRIALCRALLLQPPIVLADEPTGNLDDMTAAAVLGQLRAHASTGATVVVVTHDESIARKADDVLVIG